MPAGLSPTNSSQVNTQVGTLMRDFIRVQSLVKQQWDWLQGIDLTGEPYNMSANDQLDIKSALGPLDTSLQGVDMTFINRLVGLPA